MVFIVSSFLCLSISANAKNFEEYEYAYRYSYVNNQQVINGIVINGYDGTSKDLIIPEEIEGYPVIEIGGFAFQNCTEITGVTIPETVTEIYDYAFAGCSSLSYINILSDKMSFGMDAFSGCNSLNKVYANSIETWINNFYFYEWNTSSNPLCNGADLYLNNTLVTELVIIQDIANIKEDAFYGCTSIECVVFDDSVTTITSRAFAGCTGLKEISISESITTIGYGAFTGCTGLTKINWNAKNVNSFDPEPSVFFCAGYESEGIEVVFGENVESIPSGCFAGYADSGMKSANIKKVTIGESVTMIGDYAFWECKGLESITIPDSIVSIGYSAFMGCANLTNVIISNSINTIEARTFYNCTSLKNISIPESVEYIATDAFSGSGLEKIVINNPKCVIEYSASTIPVDAVIYGYADSPAQIYAQMYGRDFVALAAAACTHFYGEWIIDADASCTQRGFAHRVCALCNGYEFDVLDETGHADEDADNCCDVCDAIISAQTPDTGDNSETQTGALSSFFSSITEFFNRIIAWIKSLFGMA